MSLRVAAALCFWNELPEDLYRCVRAMSSIADSVVALDGAYVRYPGATPHSPRDQIDAIREAARVDKMDCLVVQPDRLWAGQVEKRSHLMALAAVNSDWIAAVDADHVVRCDRNESRLFLEHNPQCAWVSVPYWTPTNEERSMADSSIGAWHELQTKDIQQIPHLFRSLPGFRVEKRHWWYSGFWRGQRMWTWGGDDSYPHADGAAMPCAYQVIHRTMMRTPEQIMASRAFLNDRAQIVEQTGQEDAQPGMKAPVYDYESYPE